jgi:hypothetical protein
MLGRSAEADEANAVAESLVERGEPIAVEQLARHPQLFPSFTAPPVVDLCASWPRGGMPTAARSAI